jgi:phytoene desaturase
MVQLFEDIGGTVHLSAEAAKIELTDGRATAVVLKDGRRFDADLVASNADVVHTYAMLLSGTERGRAAAKSLKRKKYSMSLFVIYFGLKKHRPDIQHHTVCFGARYRELISEIFTGAELPEDFSLYLHNPCATDASLAPEGAGSFYVLSPVPHLGNADIDWAVEGPRYRDRILDYLEEHYIPGLKEDLVTSRIFTPVDFREELNAHVGSAFSLDPVLTQSAWFRPHNRDDVIPNLYIVGAGTHPGAGVPGVVGSAKATAGLMIADAALV